MKKDDPRASRSNRAIMDSAIELFLINPTASMSDIANHAGIGRATLYRHFETREKLIYALALESLKRTDEALLPIHQENLSAYDTICKGICAIIPLADRFHFLVTLWTVCDSDESKVMEIYNRQLSQLSMLIDQAKVEGVINREISTTWIVLLVDSLIYSAWWSINIKALTVEEAGPLIITSLFEGIRKR